MKKGRAGGWRCARKMGNGRFRPRLGSPSRGLFFLRGAAFHVGSQRQTVILPEGVWLVCFKWIPAAS